MKIGIATGNSSLDDRLSKKIYEPVTVWSDLSGAMEGEKEIDLFILSTEVPGKVLDFISTHGDKAVILLTDRPDKIVIRGSNLFICNTYGMMEEDVGSAVIQLLKSNQLMVFKTNLFLKKNRSNEQSKLIVTYSPAPGQGKTTFMKNLSVFVADKNRGKKVAVVDLNVYNSELLYAFGFEEQAVRAKNLESFIGDVGRPLHNGDVFIYKGLTNLHILPHISSPYEATQFTIEAVSKLLEQLKQRYDYVFVEIGSALISHTSIVPLMNADHVYVVMNENRNSLRAFERWFPEELKQKLLYRNNSVNLILNEYGKHYSRSKRNEEVEARIGASIAANMPRFAWSLEDMVVIDALETPEVKAFLASMQEITRQSGI